MLDLWYLEKLVPHAVSISQTADTANLVEWAKLALDPETRASCA